MTTAHMLEHPDGEGCIEHSDGVLIVANDVSAAVTQVLIGPLVCVIWPRA